MTKIVVQRIVFLLVTLMIMHPVSANQRPEDRVLHALGLIQSAQTVKAEKVLTQLIKDEPEFKLAHMLYADLLKSRTQSLDQVGMGLSSDDDLQQLLIETKNVGRPVSLILRKNRKFQPAWPGSMIIICMQLQSI